AAPAPVAVPAPASPFIAKVNGVGITREAFDAKYERMTRSFQARNKPVPDSIATRYRETILKQLIERELINQKIKAEGIIISDEALAQEFDEYKKLFRTDENFERYLKTSGTTLEEIKTNITHKLATEKLLEKLNGLKVTDEEIKAYYEKNKKRYEVQEQVKAAHILLKLGEKEATPEKDAEVLAKINQIRAEAMAPNADFGELAKKYSEGPSGPRGGDLGFFTRGRMVKPFEDAAFSLEVGVISEPIKTRFGYHLIKVFEKKAASARDFEEIKPQIERMMRSKLFRQATRDVVTALEKEAKIEHL
ncbi:peptidylprolyl isomerase, partial [Myxococcota bacterium]|nr:peptidylprolyl isomerase [Myxococcota bacterium]